MMNHIEILIDRYPSLSVCRDGIEQAGAAIIDCYRQGGKVLICGNGGSCADSDHIVGELMKGFRKKRQLPVALKESLVNEGGQIGEKMADSLQASLSAINLCAHSALTTAFSNDVDPQLLFAQQVIGYARKNDVLIGLSTSGNAKNVIMAGIAAKASGALTIGMCGADQCDMDQYFDQVIHVPADETYIVQELHLPVYHTICMIVEDYFFQE